VRRPWDDERVRHELESFLAGRDEWPAYREWRAAGRKRLHAEAVARRPARAWAAELGVAFPRRRPGHPAWDEARIRRELHAALAALSPVETFPTRVQLRAVAGSGLSAAVSRTGGVARWADEMGLAVRGSQGRWSDERIERELREWLGDAGVWPTKAQFAAAGRMGLLRAIYDRDGTAVWAERMGVAWRGRPRRR
jgi:hypothetical protein